MKEITKKTRDFEKTPDIWESFKKNSIVIEVTSSK